MKSLQKEILSLKRQKNAIILAHNYQRPEIQDIADFIGDSIELCCHAQKTKARMIVFCGVDFMAQSAVILNPEKKVVIPTRGALCPMAQMLPPDYLAIWQKEYPNVPVVLYVNTLGESKALCDICCTSANAVKVVKSLSTSKILFGPDSHLAAYVARETKKEIIPVPPNGYCPVHVLFEAEDILKLKNNYPQALLMVHPECPMEVIKIADFVGSTSQMCHFAQKTEAKLFLVATEIGLIYRLKKENPKKEFIPANPEAICTAMKAITLEKVYLALKEERYVVTLSKEIIEKAQEALEKMVKISS
ncbi:MAG TPA: quinolinate synthase NadA [Candidatus Desulfofervidus auxilii]|uniref:Quinolinate synthase n=1 Tax=Desulfofervidus auxilii TaxID=1621989 RepID=A0A7C0Y8H3_DESA2|nr:quinolinate synthase NadA [Candidatus Desulfofervidus auxilii]